MAGSINDFKSSFKTDFARPARFDVLIPVPLKLVGYRNTSQNLQYRCESAQLPGVTYATQDRVTYGPIEKQPYLKTFNDVTMTFIVSDDMNEKLFFDAWMNLINSQATFNMSYKSDYSTPITINQYNVSNEITYSITLNEAFPVSINQLDLDWTNETSYHKLMVTFAYYTWETDNTFYDIGLQVRDNAISTGIDAASNFISEKFGLGSGNPFWDTSSISGNF